MKQETCRSIRVSPKIDLNRLSETWCRKGIAANRAIDHGESEITEKVNGPTRP